MEFILPATTGEWLPFLAAAVAFVLGLAALLAPRLTLRLSAEERDSRAISEARSTLAGFCLGIGAVGLLLFNQPFVQLAVSAAWSFSAFGRLVSILSVRGTGAYDWLFLVVAAGLACAASAPVFGLVPA